MEADIQEAGTTEELDSGRHFYCWFKFLKQMSQWWAAVIGGLQFVFRPIAAAPKEKYWDWHLKEKSIEWWLTQETGLGDMNILCCYSI